MFASVVRLRVFQLAVVIGLICTHEYVCRIQNRHSLGDQAVKENASLRLSQW
jgi:hypothetical protein